MFYCKWCDDEFNSQKDLRKHEKICDCNPSNNSHEKFSCRYCRKIFYTKEELKKHASKCIYNSSNSYDDEDIDE